MKKKLFIIAIVVMLIFALTAVMTACNDVNDVNEDGEDNSQSDELKTKEEIEAALGDRYVITYKFLGIDDNAEDKNDLVTIGRYSNYCYYALSGNAAFVEKVGDDYFVYSDTDDDGVYDTMAEYTDSSDPATVAAELFSHTVSIEYTSKTDVSFLGRNATMYTYTQSADLFVAKYAVTYQTVIDKATGISLKHALSFSGSAMGKNVDGSGSFECTSFKTGTDAFNFIDNEVKKIGVHVWEGDFLEDIGLENVPALDADFMGGSLKQDEDGKKWNAVFSVKGDKDDTKAIVTELIQSFYAAGAKYDAENEKVAEAWNDESIYEEMIGAYLDFEAYVNNDEKNDKIKVHAYFDAADSAWIVTIDAEQYLEIE